MSCPAALSQAFAAASTCELINNNMKNLKIYKTKEEYVNDIKGG